MGRCFHPITLMHPALFKKDAKDQSVVIAAVRRGLGQNKGWLLVFDNAKHVDNLQSYLPQGKSGHVLITSRNPNWEDIAILFNIEEFSPQEALDFLCRRTAQEDPVTAEALAETLDYLPLALEQAAASMRTGKSFNKYFIYRVMFIVLARHAIIEIHWLLNRVSVYL